MQKSNNLKAGDFIMLTVIPKPISKRSVKPTPYTIWEVEFIPAPISYGYILLKTTGFRVNVKWNRIEKHIIMKDA